MWGFDLMESMEAQVDEAMGVKKEKKTKEENREMGKKSGGEKSILDSVEDVDLGDVADKVVGFFSSFTQGIGGGGGGGGGGGSEDDGGSGSKNAEFDKEEDGDSSVNTTDSYSNISSAHGNILENDGDISFRANVSGIFASPERGKTEEDSPTQSMKETRETSALPSDDVDVESEIERKLQVREKQLATQAEIAAETARRLEMAESQKDRLRDKLKTVVEKTLAIKRALVKTKDNLREARESERALREELDLANAKKAGSSLNVDEANVAAVELRELKDKYKRTVEKLKKLMQVCQRLRQVEKDLTKKAEDDTTVKNMLIGREKELAEQIDKLRTQVDDEIARSAKLEEDKRAMSSAMSSAAAAVAKKKESELREEKESEETRQHILEQCRERAEKAEAEVLRLRQRLSREEEEEAEGGKEDDDRMKKEASSTSTALSTDALDSLNEENVTLQSKIESAKARLEETARSLTSRAEAAETKASNLETRLEETEARVREEFASDRRNLEERVATLDRKIAVRERQLESKSAQYGEMHAKLSDAEGRVAALEAEIETATERSTSSEHESRKERERLLEMERNLKREIAQRQTAEKKCELLSAKSQVLNDSVLALKADLEQSRRAADLARDAAKKDNDALVSEIASVKERLEISEKNTENARADAKKCLEEKREADLSSRESLERELALARKQLRETKDQLEIAVDEKKTELANAQRKWRDAEDRFRDASKRATDATRPLLLELKNARNQRDAVKQAAEASKMSLTSRLKNTLEILENARATEAQTKYRLKDLEMASTEATENTKRLRDELTLTRDELAIATSDAVERGEQLRAMRSMIDQLRADKDRTLDEMRQVEKILQTKLDAIQNERDRLKRDLSLALSNQLRGGSGAAVDTKKSGNGAASSSSSSLLPDLREAEAGSSRSSPPPTDSVNTSSRTIVESISLKKLTVGERRGSGGIAAQYAAEQREKLETSKSRALERQLCRLESARKTLSDELVTMSEKIRTRDRKLEAAAKIVSRYRELQHKHSVLLEMLGEKQEEVDRLRTPRAAPGPDDPENASPSL
eukprot:g1692.t1